MEQRCHALALITVTETVGLLVSLSTHINAVFIAQFIPYGVVRIVTSTYSIDIELLHKTNILKHTLTGNDVAAIRVKLMTIGALDVYWLTINQQLGILYLHTAETDLLGYDFTAVLRSGQGIEIRGLCTPLLGIGKFYDSLFSLTHNICNLLAGSILKGIGNIGTALSLDTNGEDTVLVVICQTLCDADVSNLLLRILGIKIAGA